MYDGQASTDALSRAFFPYRYRSGDRANDTSADIAVPRWAHPACRDGGVMIFSFKRLCGAARGAARLSRHSASPIAVILVGIPIMGAEKRNEAARFKTLIDRLCERQGEAARRGRCRASIAIP